MRLTIYDKDPETGTKSIRDIKEQEVFFGDIPLMTQNGTFIVNGTERVIVSQLHRSPGVFFETASNRTYFLGKIIPYRGSWVEFEYDQKNTLYVRIDRKRKFLGTIFLRALGLRSDEEILKTFYTVDTIAMADGKLHWTINRERASRRTCWAPSRRTRSLVKGEEIAHSGRKVTPSILKALRAAKVTQVEVEAAELDGAMTAADVVDHTTGEILVEANVELNAERLHKITESGVTNVEVFFPERDDVGNIISNTLRRDSVRKPEEALIEIYRKLRPGDPPTLDTATALFEGMFFDPRKYDFSRVGRLEVQHQALREPGRDSAGSSHADAGGLLRDHSLPAEAAQEHRRGGRHRSPWQPPRPRCRRADGEPVPHRPGPHGARHQGKDERLSGDVDGDAARPDQRQAGHGRDPRVLRIVAAFAVHGSDQPALGDHAQAPSLRTWAGRSEPRARRL